MPDYMLLLYAPEADDATEADRWSELPLWDAVTNELRDSGRYVANGALDPGARGAVVRTRAGATDVTDGPFEVTKEMLAGFYVLACRDLDEAVELAARLPGARYGSVEVRPLMSRSQVEEERGPVG